jgi:hypothetical protein
VGVGVGARVSRNNYDPPPQPSPSRLRACPLPASPNVTKSRQAGVWLGREQTEFVARAESYVGEG